MINGTEYVELMYTYVGQKNTLIDSCAYRNNEPNASLNLAGTVTTCHMSFSCDGVRMSLNELVVLLLRLFG